MTDKLYFDKLEIGLIETDFNFQILNLELKANLDPVILKSITLDSLKIDYKKGVVINGKAPVWLFAHLVHLLHIARWVATFDPRQGGIVVQSHHSDFPQLGDIIESEKITKFISEIPKVKKVKSESKSHTKIIAFLGPPHSGKTVLINSLKEILFKFYNNIYSNDFFIIRGCPDGEGDWSAETNPDVTKIIRRKGSFSEEFIADILGDIQKVSQTKKLIFVDCGGIIDKYNYRILEKCTHAVIISNNLEEILKWEGLVLASEIKIVTKIFSVLENNFEKISDDIYKIGKFERGLVQEKLPEVLIKEITDL